MAHTQGADIEGGGNADDGRAYGRRAAHMRSMVFDIEGYIGGGTAAVH
jgi:hypothetical protein